MKNKNDPFVDILPAHIGLNYFGKESYDFDNPMAPLTLDKPNYEKALRECKNHDFDFRLTLDKLTPTEVNETFTTSNNICSFSLTT